MKFNFLIDNIVDVAIDLADQGIRVIAAGLDMDLKVKHLDLHQDF